MHAWSSTNRVELDPKCDFVGLATLDLDRLAAQRFNTVVVRVLPEDVVSASRGLAWVVPVA